MDWFSLLVMLKTYEVAIGMVCGGLLVISVLTVVLFGLGYDLYVSYKYRRLRKKN